MKLGGGNPKCAYCNKSVYKAEEKRWEHPKEGLKFFHVMCFALYKKEMDKAEADERNREYYVKPDVTPAYYRVGDPISGTPARLETSNDEQ